MSDIRGTLDQGEVKALNGIRVRPRSRDAQMNTLDLSTATLEQAIPVVRLFTAEQCGEVVSDRTAGDGWRGCNRMTTQAIRESNEPICWQHLAAMRRRALRRKQ